MGNFKVGDKVVPKSKSVGTPLEKSVELEKASEKNQKFLYVNSFEEGRVLCHSKEVDYQSGDYFLKEDLTLYKTKPSKKQRIETLEKEVSELKLIVHELRERKPSVFATAVGQDLEAEYAEQVKDLPSTDNSVEDKQTDVIEFEGQQYRKVGREAVEGDVVIFTSIPEDESGMDVEEGKPYRAYEGKGIYKKYIKGDTGFMVHIYGGGILRGTTETVDVYEPINQPVQRQTVPCSATRPPIEEVGEAFFKAANKVLNPKTANELRGEVIEKAKGFVEEHKIKQTVVFSVTEGKFIEFSDVYNVPGHLYSIDDYDAMCHLDFVVNESKKTIVALLRGATSKKMYSKGIAKCNPSDVFNEHIGKAIALGRALGLDVSEFEQAVQPTIAVGQRIQSLYVGKDYGDPRFSDLKVTSINKFGHPEHDNGMYTSDYNIINDTNAIYGGVE